MSEIPSSTLPAERRPGGGWGEGAGDYAESYERLSDLAWSRRVRAYWRGRPYVCVACSRRGVRGDPRRRLHVHHLGYWFPRGHEPAWVLVGLCVPCHARVHALHDRLYPGDRLPYRHLAEVTVRWLRRERWRWWRYIFRWQAGLPPWAPPPRRLVRAAAAGRLAEELGGQLRGWRWMRWVVTGR